MKKKDIEKIFERYDAETINLISFLKNGISAFKGTSTEAKDISLLCETVFHKSYVEVEAFLSDYTLSCINRNHIKYLTTQEESIVTKVRECEGDWYANRIAFSKVRNLKMDEVISLLIPEGGNITYFTLDKFKKYALKNLGKEYSDKIKLYNNENELVYALSRSIRNCISHRSKKSLDTLNSILKDIRKIQKFAFLPEKINNANIIGPTLKKQQNGKTYAEILIEELRKVILKIK